MSTDDELDEFEEDFESEEEFLDDDEAWDEEDGESYEDEFSEGDEDGGEEGSGKKKKKLGKFEMGLIGGAVVVGGLAFMFLMGGDKTPVAGTPQTQQAQKQADGSEEQEQQVLTQRDIMYGRNLDTEETRAQKAALVGVMNDPAALAALNQEAEDAYYDEDLVYEDEEEDDEFQSYDSDEEYSPSEDDEFESASDDDFATSSDYEFESASDDEFEFESASDGEFESGSDYEFESGLDDEFEFETASDSELEGGQPPTPSAIGMEEDSPLTPMHKIAGIDGIADGKDFEDSTGFESASLPTAGEILKKSGHNNMAAASNDRLDSLDHKLDKIVDRLDHIEIEMASLKKSSMHGNISSSKAKISTHSAKPKNVSSSVAVRPAKAVSKKWVLKAARPGTAWVARAGENDMRSVSVGESLAGIGRITSVDVVDARWVVQGTKGKIYQ